MLLVDVYTYATYDSFPFTSVNRVPVEECRLHQHALKENFCLIISYFDWLRSWIFKAHGYGLRLLVNKRRNREI